MPDAVVLSKTEFYTIKPNQPISLSVTIGDNQPGGTAVTLNGELIGSGGQIKNLVIGKGKDLRDAEIECTTTVKDMNPDTNHTSVTYALSGGKEDQVFPYELTVNQAGGRAVYIVSFMLE